MLSTTQNYGLAAVSERKARGAYFTPQPVVDLLVRWTISKDTERFLDPSFGDGRFLSGSVKRLSDLGVSGANRRVYGVEVSPPRGTLTALGAAGVPRKNLIRADFFSTDLNSWGGARFDAIAGNPPYIRHHLLDADSRRLAQEHASRVGIELSERADSWAYFCVALLDYLEPSGRLAVLLPGAVLHADYALPLLHALSEARGHVQLIRLKKRLFDDALERTIILLVDGRREEPGVEYQEATDEQDLASLLAPSKASFRRTSSGVAISTEIGRTPEVRLRTRLSWFLGAKTASLWERATALPEVRTLAELADIRIGVVTGANRFFVRTSDEVDSLGIDDDHSAPIVSRGGWLTAARWTAADQFQKCGSRSRLLLITPDQSMTKALKEEIALAEGEGLDQRGHCRKRDTWYSIGDERIADLFLPYMGAAAPRLVVNVAGAHCTNAVHRVYVRAGQASLASITAASWTSLYRLSAELVGRSYAGGVLKLEPGEAKLLRVPDLPCAANYIGEIEAVRASRGVDAARARADRLLLVDGLGLTKKEVSSLHTAAIQLQERRSDR
jgi:adenine-specific DNA-methyltransferase